MVFRAREIKVYRAAGAVQSSQVRSGLDYNKGRLETATATAQ
jgi:hypothetical protein